jgi:ionotropic glutamate receptor
MSTAILKLSESGELQKIHDKWISGQACSSKGANQVDRLPLTSFYGLFLVCGSACFVVLLLYLVKMVHQYTRQSGRSSQSFFSFVKEKENHVHKMKEPENSRDNEK